VSQPANVGSLSQVEHISEEVRKFSRYLEHVAENPVILRPAQHYVGRDLQEISYREATRLDGKPVRAIIIVAKLACGAYCCCSSEDGAKRAAVTRAFR
jgi:hypothetical protein